MRDSDEVLFVLAPALGEANFDSANVVLQVQFNTLRLSLMGNLQIWENVLVMLTRMEGF